MEIRKNGERGLSLIELLVFATIFSVIFDR